MLELVRSHDLRTRASSSRRERRRRLDSGGGCTSGSDSFKTEEKTSASSRTSGEAETYDLLELGDEPTSAPTGCPDIGDRTITNDVEWTP